MKGLYVAAIVGACVGGAAVLLLFITIRLGRYVAIAMECDELIDQLLDDAPSVPEPPARAVARRSHLDSHEHGGGEAGEPANRTEGDRQGQRQRLAALAMGGQSKRYLGKEMSADQIDHLSDEDVDKLYTRYEARLGASMTRTLGSAVLQAYAMVASRFLPIPADKQPLLAADLEADPFVGHAINTMTCELYHRYGMYLAPFTAMLSTFKYCQASEHTSTEYDGGTDCQSISNGGNTGYGGGAAKGGSDTSPCAEGSPGD